MTETPLDYGDIVWDHPVVQPFSELKPVWSILGLMACQDNGVVDKYEGEIQVAEVAPTQRTAQQDLDSRMLVNILAETDRLEAAMLDMNKAFQVAQNPNTGLYTVEQEDEIAIAYSRYLQLRKGLFHIAFRHKGYASIDALPEQDQSFLLAYSAGLALYRNATVIFALFKDQPNARRKLNEGDPVRGFPPRMFDDMAANVIDPDNVRLVLNGVSEFHQRRERLLVIAPTGLVERLDRYEQELGDAHKRLGEGQRDVLWPSLKAKVSEPVYQGQSFVSVMVSHVRGPVADKGFTPETVQGDIVPLLQPGDIVLTTRDGYLSNAFLPGSWGHAALYLGPAEKWPAPVAAQMAGHDDDGRAFAAIEAIGEGVRLSSAAFALHANRVAVLRPRVDAERVQQAGERALSLLGAPYDFSFDLSSQDKIICTELVYRAYAPFLEMPLDEVMGRKTLQPDQMVRVLLSEPQRADFVLFGESVEGGLKTRSLDELMATVGG